MAVAAGAMTVDVVLVVAVTPAVGVWEDERVRTGVSGGDWLPAVVDSSGALATTKADAWKKQTESHVTRVCLKGLLASKFWGKQQKARKAQQIQFPRTPGEHTLALLT